MATGTATTIAKWGNSTGVRIPRKIAEQADLHEGDQVDLQVEAPGVIVLRTLKSRPTLESLVSRITSKNRHNETDWGQPKGHEAW